MECVRLYECLCDATRLRILNLLRPGPLCVCHLQAILRAPQVRVSKHLRYLRARGMVRARRRGQWMEYRLATPAPALLEANLRCLQDLLHEGARPVFRRDLVARARAVTACASPLRACG
jgi:ArsR family transcriptional regulator